MRHYFDLRGSLRRACRLGVALAASLLAPAALAANPTFQDFFFAACVNPSGALAARCTETDGGLGNVSGDSESSLNPSQTLSSADAARLAATQQGQEIRERLQARREGHSDGAGAQVDLGPFSLLVNARTGSSESERRVDADAERGSEVDETSAEIGLDYRLNDRAVVGGWVQWGRSELDFDQENAGANFTPLGNAGAIDTDRLGATAFFSTMIREQGYLDASISYTTLDLDVLRNSVFQESNRLLAQTNSINAGSAEGSEWMLALNAGFNATFGSWSVSPYAGITHIDTTFDSYREADVSGAGLALAVELADQTVTLGQLGVSISNAVSMDGWVMLPQARIEYSTDLSADRSQAAVRYVNDLSNTTFDLRGDSVDAGRVDIAVGVAAILRNGWIPFVEYQLTTGNADLDRYQISAGLRIEL